MGGVQEWQLFIPIGQDSEENFWQSKKKKLNNFSGLSELTQHSYFSLLTPKFVRASKLGISHT